MNTCNYCFSKHPVYLNSGIQYSPNIWFCGPDCYHNANPRPVFAPTPPVQIVRNTPIMMPAGIIGNPPVLIGPGRVQGPVLIGPVGVQAPVFIGPGPVLIGTRRGFNIRGGPVIGVPGEFIFP
jgi:hypothetical protein